MSPQILALIALIIILTIIFFLLCFSPWDASDRKLADIHTRRRNLKSALAQWDAARNSQNRGNEFFDDIDLAIAALERKIAAVNREELELLLKKKKGKQ